jgi:predicted SnoaL-like aldol condensation-catalyzing enzyme
MTSNAQIVLDSIEVIWNKGELERIPEFYTEEFISHQGGYGIWPWPPGRAGVNQVVTSMRTAFPDYLEEPAIVFSEGDMVIVRQTISGTHTGGTTLPATGKQMSVVDMMICRLRDGKLHEQWGLSDFYSMLIQLGLMEPLV